MLELKNLLFQSLYTWIVALIRLLVSNFFEFLEFVLLFPYFRLALLCAFNEFELLIKNTSSSFPPRKVFGRLRPRHSLLYSLGWQLWVESSRLIILEGEVSPS
jgi:hypothetical protein